MTKEQIEIYEVCKKDLEQLKIWKTKLPFKKQNHGCGSRDPNIYFVLEDIHQKMYDKVVGAINEAINDIEDKIDKL